MSDRRAKLRVVPTTEADFERKIAGVIPPHDLDAEAAVLSAVLCIGASVLALLFDTLRPEHFYSDANGCIYRAMCEIYEAAQDGAALDPVTVANYLRSQGTIAQAGGASYLGQISDATPAVANVEAHAAIVVEHALQRQFIRALSELRAEGYGVLPVPGQVWRDQASIRINDLAQGATKATGVSMREAMSEALRDLGTDGEQAGMTGIPTGLTEIDAAVAGLHPREVTLIGGRTGGGKTSLAHTIAMHVSMTPKIVTDEHGRERRVPRGVVLIGLDNMTPKSISMRLACAHGRVDSVKIKSRTADADDWRRYTASTELVASLPIIVEAHTTLTPLGVRAKLRAAKRRLEREHGAELALAVIDYAQLLDCDAATPEMNQEQRHNRNGMSILRTAAAFDIPILLLIQLNKAGEARDCEALAHHAQNKWTITWRPGEKRATIPGIRPRPVPCPATIRIDKAREGRLGSCETNFYPMFTLFTDGEAL